MVDASQGEQLVVFSFFSHASLVKNHDPVRIADCGESMGDDERRAIRHDRAQTGLHLHLGLRVDGGGRLVQHEQGRIECERTGE